MAAASESQGLKIAVAAFVSLTVILAVSSYFLYSAYTQAEARRKEADSKAEEAQKVATKALDNMQELREKAGFKGMEEFEALKTAIGKFQDKVSGEIGELNADIKKRVAEYQQAGGTDPKIKELQDEADRIFLDFSQDPNKTLSSTIDRLRDLLRYNAKLTTEFAIDNLGLRHDLESSNLINAEKLGQQTDALGKSKADLESEHAEHERLRQELLAKVDKLQTDFANAQTENETLKTQKTQMKDDYDKQVRDLASLVAFLKDVLGQKETVMDRPDGLITAVDYAHNEVLTNVTRQMGARAMMSFAIFDSRGPIPNKHPKANIELIAVDERGSRGRILPAIRTGQSLQSPADIEDPIRLGDYIYSAVWSPNTPERFALIGKIDLNRDNRDDREDLKRLIEASGGIIEYDLPPPGAGRESGQLSGKCRYYVFDDRPPLITPTRRTAGPSQEEIDFMNKQTEAQRLARSLAIQPISIERLMIYLGYSPNMVEHGRVENFDKKLSDSILFPRGRLPAGVSPGGAAPATGSETPPPAPGRNGATPAPNGAPAPK